MKKILIISLTILLSACSISRSGEYSSVDTEQENSNRTLDRFVQNAFVKEKGDHSITYEYRDIRVDELAGLAARYCVDTYNMPAHLKSIRLHKNNARLATFHCQDLQDN